MTGASLSAALPGPVHQAAVSHLVRDDGQEDLCFALWHPSRGRHRRSVLISKLILPEAGERNVHGNASFEPSYFERALTEAGAAGAGLALLHSHPRGSGWQDMSPEDIAAEQGHAAAAFGATGMPLAGLTIAGANRKWSGRLWKRTAPRQYRRVDCGSVRVVGDALDTTFYDRLMPPPRATREQVKTVSCWGERHQRDLARIRVGIVGAGSVGGFVAEALARTGLENVTLIDFDVIEEGNLDRLVYASRDDIGEIKVERLARHLGEIATAADFTAEPVVRAVYEDEGFRAALDCDVLVSCVDRPWGRQVMNLIAYAHLIPVVDGGIAVRKNRKGDLVKADWRSHTATVGRQCLACIGQFDPGHVQMERAGLLDDPTYIENLAADHPLRASENVFAFSMACASQQILQLLSLVLAPMDQPNPGAQLYHFVGGFMEEASFAPCHPECLYRTIISEGDHCSFVMTGERPYSAHDKIDTSESSLELTQGLAPPPVPSGMWARFRAFWRRVRR